MIWIYIPCCIYDYWIIYITFCRITARSTLGILGSKCCCIQPGWALLPSPWSAGSVNANPVILVMLEWDLPATIPVHDTCQWNLYSRSKYMLVAHIYPNFCWCAVSEYALCLPVHHTCCCMPNACSPSTPGVVKDPLLFRHPNPTLPSAGVSLFWVLCNNFKGSNPLLDYNLTLPRMNKSSPMSCSSSAMQCCFVDNRF